MQVVRMQLGLNDPDESASNFADPSANSHFQATLNRTQDNGVAGTGHLVMFPRGLGLVPAQTGGALGATELEDSGALSFLVFESPSVTGGSFAPNVPTGVLGYDIYCSGRGVCSQWLEGPIESRAESSFDHGSTRASGSTSS